MLNRRRIVLPALFTFLVVGCASTPPGEESKPAPAAAQSPRSLPVAPPTATQARAVQPVDISKHSIYYDFDKYAVKDEFRPVIMNHASYLTAHRGAHVVVEGNCDERGSREYNLALGQRRAESVHGLLKVLGVPDTQVDTVSWGEEKPKAVGHDESAWAQNRRSDIVYKRME